VFESGDLSADSAVIYIGLSELWLESKTSGLLLRRSNDTSL